jgi:hypothetical protein
MYWNDEWDEAYDDLVYRPEDEEEEEEDENAMYFDVPLPYRPIQIKRRRK